MKKSKAKAPAVGYSDGERKALEALKKSPEKKLTTLELVELVYGSAPPFHARHAVVGTMKSLSAKVEKNREKFAVKKSRRAGSKPATFSLEERSV